MNADLYRRTSSLLAPAFLVGLVLLTLPSCLDKSNPAASGNGGGKRQSSTAPDEIFGPGIDFTRRSVGLEAVTLDYTGTSAAALAGAKSAADVFYGQSVRGDLTLYHRNTKQNSRRLVAKIPQYHDGSMAASSDGSRIVYCRFQGIRKLTDDSSVVYPDPVAVTYTMDVANGKEQQVFDIGSAEFIAWRANGVQPFISPDGKTVCQLAYNADRLLLHHQSQQWLVSWMRQQNPPKDYTEEQKEFDKVLLTDIIEIEAMRSTLLERDVPESELNPDSAALHKALLDLNREMASAEVALLHSHDGKSRVLPLKLLPDYASFYYFVAAMGSSQVVLCSEDPDAELYRPQPFFVIDLESGELRKLTELSGALKLFALTPDESTLLVAYSPIDPQTKVLDPQTHLARIDIASGQVTDQKLTGEYLGIMDLSADGRYLAGQDPVTYNIYLVDSQTGERELISEQLGPLTGLFLDDRGESLIYMTAGITYWVDLSPPARRSKRVEASEFSKYQDIVLDYLRRIGFSIDPSKVTLRFEERKGMGAHEVAAELSPMDDQNKAMLLRIDVKSGQVVSLWLPTGQFLPAEAHLKQSKLDYYDAEKIASKLVDLAGWISAERRVLYQPGPNPLYDQKSDSYIITYREKYQLASNSEVAYSNEATVRINAGKGELLEMTLTLNDQVQKQPITVGRDRLDFQVRNIQETAMPAEAPVRVDSEGARLIVYTKRTQEEVNGVLVGKVQPRLCWEVDTLMEPEGDLVFTNLIDTETGERLGSLSYMPMSPASTTTER